MFFYSNTSFDICAYVQRYKAIDSLMNLTYLIIHSILISFMFKYK